MIQEFSVQNFLSFKEKQTISFVATSDKTLVDELVVEPKPGVKLLRMALIYGANASGKSNLLHAIQTLWKMLFIAQDKEHKEVEIYRPFELTKSEPTNFEITFWANGRKYQYELVYDKHSILYEKMSYTTDNDVLSLMYERKKGLPIVFGGTLRVKAKQRDSFNNDTLNNHTVLSTLNKKNIDAPIAIIELYNWIKSNIHEMDIHNDGVKIVEQSESDPSLKKLILELLNKADFNISDFSMVEVSVPEEIAEEIRNDSDLSDIAKERFLKPRKQILFSHATENDSFQISFGMESSGTRVYFRLARLLYELKSNGCIIMEDEIEDSLHYDLLIHYLQTYLQFPNQSQLIVATHNQLLLDEDWMIRRDMVWFIEKDRKTSSSTLYRASGMGIHKNVSLMNAYKIGKLGAKPILGSTLLSFEE